MSEILKRINSANHVVVVSHINPDADSISSASAMYTYLLQKHKKVSWYCKSENISNNLSFIPWFEKIRNNFPSSADLVISLDCAHSKRLGIEFEVDLINIDHHKSNTKFAKFNIVESDAISTTQVLFNFFNSNNIKINKKMATALYAGLLDDSNGFMNDNVDGTTFAFAKELIDNGADYKICNNFIIKNISLGALRLKAIMFKNMMLESEAKIAIFCVNRDEIKESGAFDRECELALEESLNLPHVEVAMLIRENNDFTLKASIRSKKKFDSSKIALAFGGGGHFFRAGFKFGNDISLKDAKEKILNLIKKEI
ncbi:MAG: DHH family phosphoesterase [Sulfurimonas sp.]|nr:DHH family phosphoesterase [Sulfurimonas sp.]